MAKKVENEQVVNRFLLSTVYAILAAFGLYFLNIASWKWFMSFGDIINVMMWGGVAACVASVVILIVKKKFSLYYPILFLYIALAGMFLNLNWIFPQNIDSIETRIKMVGAVLAILYIYELVVYFLRVNKVEGQNNNKKKAK